MFHECGRGSESRNVVWEGMGGNWTLEEHMIMRCSQEGKMKQVDEKSESTNSDQSTADKMLRMYLCRGLAM